MTTYGYARSAAGSTGPQEDALRAAGCTTIYADHGQSRTGWQECMGALQPGDTLTVWSMDRFGCRMSDPQRAVDTIQARGARLTVLNGVELADLRARIAALGAGGNGEEAQES